MSANPCGKSSRVRPTHKPRIRTLRISEPNFPGRSLWTYGHKSAPSRHSMVADLVVCVISDASKIKQRNRTYDHKTATARPRCIRGSEEPTSHDTADRSSAAPRALRRPRQAHRAERCSSHHHLHCSPALAVASGGAGGAAAGPTWRPAGPLAVPLPPPLLLLSACLSSPPAGRPARPPACLPDCQMA